MSLGQFLSPSPATPTKSTIYPKEFQNFEFKTRPCLIMSVTHDTEHIVYSITPITHLGGTNLYDSAMSLRTKKRFLPLEPNPKYYEDRIPVRTIPTWNDSSSFLLLQIVQVEGHIERDYRGTHTISTSELERVWKLVEAVRSESELAHYNRRTLPTTTTTPPPPQQQQQGRRQRRRQGQQQHHHQQQQQQQHQHQQEQQQEGLGKRAVISSCPPEKLKHGLGQDDSPQSPPEQQQEEEGLGKRAVISSCPPEKQKLEHGLWQDESPQAPPVPQLAPSNFATPEQVELGHKSTEVPDSRGMGGGGVIPGLRILTPTFSIGVQVCPAPLEYTPEYGSLVDDIIKVQTYLDCLDREIGEREIAEF